jgi:hypothetical protein
MDTTISRPTLSQPSGVARLWSRLRDALHLAAGVSAQDMAQLNQRCSIQYATLGLVFVLNFIVLVAAWVKVGWAYWGAVGVFVPGLAVPAMFILGLDRLVAMRPRQLEGELAPYSAPGQGGLRLEPVLRVGMALALSALTTLTFMMSMAAPSIARLQARDAVRANASVRAEIEARVDSQYRLAAAQAQAREDVAEADRKALQTRIDTLSAQLEEVQRTARQSRDNAAKEAGGLDARLQGKGPKYEAQQQLALQNDQAAADLAAQLRQATAARQNAQAELAQARAAGALALNKRTRDLADLEDVLKTDLRYTAPVHGLFADAAAFLRLFNDPQEGAGFWLLALVGGGVLLALETASLIALTLNPASPLDVLRTASNRQMAAEIVAEHEVAVAQARARAGSPVRVRPDGPARQAVQVAEPGAGPAAG